MDTHELLNLINGIQPGSMGDSARIDYTLTPFVELLHKYESNKLSLDELINSFKSYMEDLCEEYPENSVFLVYDNPFSNVAHTEAPPKYDPENIENFVLSLNSLLSACEETLLGELSTISMCSFYEFVQNLRKSTDDLNLGEEEIRECSYDFISAMIYQRYEDSERKLLQMTSEMSGLEKDIKALEDNVRNNTVGSLTILSIFTGIVMAFSGGFQLISSFFSNISNQSDFKLIFVLCLSSFVLFNCLYLFIRMIVSTSKVGSSSSLTKMSILVNFILILLMLIFGFLHTRDNYMAAAANALNTQAAEQQNAIPSVSISPNVHEPLPSAMPSPQPQ